MSALCRQCCVSGPLSGKRRPNSASYFTLYQDGVVLATCELHAHQAVRAFAIAIPLAPFSGMLVNENETRQSIVESLKLGLFSRGFLEPPPAPEPPPPQRSIAVVVDELLGDLGDAEIVIRRRQPERTKPGAGTPGLALQAPAVD